MNERQSWESSPASFRLAEEEAGGTDSSVGMTEFCFLGMSLGSPCSMLWLQTQLKDM